MAATVSPMPRQPPNGAGANSPLPFGASEHSAEPLSPKASSRPPPPSLARSRLGLLVRFPARCDLELTALGGGLEVQALDQLGRLDLQCACELDQRVEAGELAAPQQL